MDFQIYLNKMLEAHSLPGFLDTSSKNLVNMTIS